MIYRATCRACKAVLTSVLAGTAHDRTTVQETFRVKGWTYVRLEDLQYTGLCDKCWEAYKNPPIRA